MARSLLLLLALAVFSGCASSGQPVDPFYGRTTIEPPQATTTVIPPGNTMPTPGTPPSVLAPIPASPPSTPVMMSAPPTSGVPQPTPAADSPSGASLTSYPRIIRIPAPGSPATGLQTGADQASSGTNAQTGGGQRPAVNILDLPGARTSP